MPSVLRRRVTTALAPLAHVSTVDGGIGHTEIRNGDSILLSFDAQPDWPDTPSMLRIFVDDAEATFARLQPVLVWSPAR
jgi:hypothetical protein